MSSTLVVVAGVLEREGRILICQRSAASRNHPLKWEFPGGKLERGETPRQALERELNEELGIRAVIGDELASFPFTYPGRPPVHLMFFRVPSFEGEIENRQFEDMRWELPAQLPTYDFLEGDVEFVRTLVNG